MPRKSRRFSRLTALLALAKEKKKEYNGESSDMVEGSGPSVVTENVLVSKEVLQKLLLKKVCQLCGDSCSLSFTGTESATPNLIVTCSCITPVWGPPDRPSCVVSFRGSSTSFRQGDIRLVYNSIMNGSGFAGFCRTAATLNLPTLDKLKYMKHCKFLQSYMKSFVNEKQPELVKSVRKSMISEDEADEPFLDIAVSFSGSWVDNSIGSHICVAFVIHADTGLVLDLEVISNACESCLKKKIALPQTEFDAWKVSHESFCTKNFDGESSAMNAEAAVRLWRRSEKMGLRYTFLIGNEDSAFNAICALNEGAGPYTVPVSKEESISDVSRKLCSLLDSLHSKLWEKCHKIKYGHLENVYFSACDTMLVHNFGKTSGSLLVRMGLASETATLEKIPHSSLYVSGKRKYDSDEDD